MLTFTTKLSADDESSTATELRFVTVLSIAAIAVAIDICAAVCLNLGLCTFGTFQRAVSRNCKVSQLTFRDAR